MFDKIKRIFSKKSDDVPGESFDLDSLAQWLDGQEESCIRRRTSISTESRERLLALEQDLKELLDGFGEESSDELHHPKVEQVNKHALPQFCKKIESELEGDFSEDDETFYREVAALINGCFKAYRGPGRYLHHLYPEEVRLFKQTLDQMGLELNRMTDVIRVSRERLSRIDGVRDMLTEYTDLVSGSAKVDTEEATYQLRLSELTSFQDELEAQLMALTSSDAYSGYAKTEGDLKNTERQLNEARESLDSFIRTAIPVWKRAARIFQEQGKKEEEKKIEDLIQLASSPRRSDADLTAGVLVTSGSLFALIGGDLLQTKNSFEKSMFSSPDTYTGKISSLHDSIPMLSGEVQRMREMMDHSPVTTEKERLMHQIEMQRSEISTLMGEKEKLHERRVSLADKRKAVLGTLQERFTELSDRRLVLDIPEEP
ncbi:MAG: hypothetical protein LUQ07_01510 [Methanospirillum sp.]|nr:hypothetical protein [Methanospirillum sp.]